MLIAAVACVIGLGLLARAADEMVVGSARLAAIYRISPVVIGALVIGFGTSAPELLVSSIAAARGSIDIATGNVVGSNIANLTMVLGLAALLCPLTVTSSTLKREAPLTILATAMFAAALLRGRGLDRVDGAVLLVGAVVAVLLIVVPNRRGDGELTLEVEEFLDVEHEHRPRAELGRTLAGLAGTLLGAHLLVSGSTTIAAEIGLAEGFVGLTLVAVGTSLPELVTAIQAARRREHDLIVGNLLGSNLFNSLAVGGVAALVGPAKVAEPDLAVHSVAVMMVVSLVALAAMMSGRRVVPAEGVVLLITYAIAVPLLAT